MGAASAFILAQATTDPVPALGTEAADAAARTVEIEKKLLAAEADEPAPTAATPAAPTAIEGAQVVAEPAATPPAAAAPASEPTAAAVPPVEEAAASAPAAEPAAAAPSEGTTTSAPVAEPATAAPMEGTTTSAPVAESTVPPPVEAASASEPVTESSATQPTAAATASAPATESTATPPVEAASEPVTESTATQPSAAATASAPDAEPTVTPPTEAVPATADTSTAAAPDTTAKPATVTEVSAEAVQEATDSGKDVVISNATTAEEQALIEEARTATLAAAAALETQEPETVKEEVVTVESTRSSGDEATSTASAARADDDDDNQVWKYLGAAAAGAVVGALIPSLGGKLVQDQGDRVIVEREGELYVHKDENLLLRRPGVTVQTERFAGGIVRDTVHRQNGSRVVTVRDAGGFVLKRTRILPDGREIVLIDETRYGGNAPASGNWEQTLPPRYDVKPGERYIVDSSRANRGTVRQTLMAPPVQDVGRFFTLRDVRDSERVRALMPRIDLDAVHFALGSAAIHPSQAEGLAVVGDSMANVIAENPREIFLIEGHTDAIGSNLMNLALSDRRAEAVALALTEYFAIPPENLLVQGYGERHLKVDTQSANQANRRATVRRITPLIDAGSFNADLRR